MLHGGETRIVSGHIHPKIMYNGDFIGSGGYLFYAGLKFFETPCSTTIVQLMM